MSIRLWRQTNHWQRVQVGIAGSLLLLIGVVLTTTTVGTQLWSILRDPSGEHVHLLLQSTLLWLPLVIIGLMILHTLIPVPAEIIALAAGRILGPFWGFVTVWVGAMLGAYVGFWLARVLGQTVLPYVVAPRYLLRVHHGLQRLNIPLVLAMRLFPVISFNLLNYALGLTTMSWWQFTWTTGVGILPITALVVFGGAYLHDWRMLLLLILLALLVGLVGYWICRRCMPGFDQPLASAYQANQERTGPVSRCTKFDQG